MHLKLTAFYEKALEGGFTCGFEEMPDVFSQAKHWKRQKKIYSML